MRTLMVSLLFWPAAALGVGKTSCDITTGASCLWNEGCDCDHDGYVRESGKAKKYCHWTKCPIDANDANASILGKASTYNADGDGYTTAYDCDDNDPCYTTDCSVSSCAEPPPPPPPPPDPGPTVEPDAGPIPEPDAGPTPEPDVVTPAPDVPSAAEPSLTDASAPPPPTSGPISLDGPPPLSGVTDEPFLASGTTTHPTPPPPGCAAAPGPAPAAAGLALFAAAALLVRRRRVMVVVAALLLSGCVTVKPWERAVLAKPAMQFGADGAEVQLEEHVFQYREASAGGFGFGGGGCGCN